MLNTNFSRIDRAHTLTTLPWMYYSPQILLFESVNKSADTERISKGKGVTFGSLLWSFIVHKILEML